MSAASSLAVAAGGVVGPADESDAGSEAVATTAVGAAHGMLAQLLDSHTRAVREVFAQAAREDARARRRAADAHVAEITQLRHEVASLRSELAFLRRQVVGGEDLLPVASSISEPDPKQEEAKSVDVEDVNEIPSRNRHRESGSKASWANASRSTVKDENKSTIVTRKDAKKLFGMHPTTTTALRQKTTTAIASHSRKARKWTVILKEAGIPYTTSGSIYKRLREVVDEFVCIDGDGRRLSIRDGMGHEALAIPVSREKEFLNAVLAMLKRESPNVVNSESDSHPDEPIYAVFDDSSSEDIEVSKKRKLLESGKPGLTRAASEEIILGIMPSFAELPANVRTAVKEGVRRFLQTVRDMDEDEPLPVTPGSSDFVVEGGEEREEFEKWLHGQFAKLFGPDKLVSTQRRD
ncbi:hypothetical protein HDU83_001653 [Entophlyctis luteolus]|nr:hypothetical protein HDU83_001653 [Entophlyctis luteolus]KAJ3387407.1 hypothetical protein HDU84_000794 [Entophlyctis sp. JEL0112]